MDKKGQMSADLIFVTLIAIVIMAGFVSFISNESQQNQTGNLGQARMQGENVAETVNTVYTNGPGYTINLTIPSTPSLTAIISGSTHTVTVNCENQNVVVNLIPTNIEDATLSSGSSYIITNNNGTIQISPNKGTTS